MDVRGPSGMSSTCWFVGWSTPSWFHLSSDCPLPEQADPAPECCVAWRGRPVPPGVADCAVERWPSCPPRFPVTLKCGLCRCREDVHGRLRLSRLCYPHRPIVVQKSPSHSTQALAWLSSLEGGRLQWFRGATCSLGLTLRIKKSSDHSLAVATEQVRGVHYGGK